LSSGDVVELPVVMGSNLPRVELSSSIVRERPGASDSSSRVVPFVEPPQPIPPVGTFQSFQSVPKLRSNGIELGNAHAGDDYVPTRFVQ
jgi:hypothetical protein